MTSFVRVGDWGPSRGLIMADAAKLRATSTSLGTTIYACEAWGFRRGKADAIAGKASDPVAAVALAVSLGDASFSDPEFKAKCLNATAIGYVKGYKSASRTSGPTSIAKAPGPMTPAAPPSQPKPEIASAPGPAAKAPISFIERCREYGKQAGRNDARANRARDPMGAATLYSSGPAGDLGPSRGLSGPDWARCRQAIIAAYTAAYDALGAPSVWALSPAHRGYI